jgi:ubiquinone/menaquinone biosynthesis C-methylase UbiE
MSRGIYAQESVFLLDNLLRRFILSARQLADFHVVEGSAACLPFSSHTFDAAFLVSVLGEISQPKECLDSLRRVVRRGLLPVTEMRGVPDALPQSKVVDLVETGGFELQEKCSFSCGFTLNFRRAKKQAVASNK